MFVWWYHGLIGYLVVGVIYCQDSNPLSIAVEESNEPDLTVKLSVDSQPKSPTALDTGASTAVQASESVFACHECINCHLKSNMTSRTCESGINMCYTISKLINNSTQIIRRGCSTSKGECTVPEDDQSNSLDSITCCSGHKCNQAIQFKPWFFLLILNLFIIIYI